MWHIVNQPQFVIGKVQKKLMKGRGANFPISCLTRSTNQEGNS